MCIVYAADGELVGRNVQVKLDFEIAGGQGKKKVISRGSRAVGGLIRVYGTGTRKGIPQPGATVTG